MKRPIFITAALLLPMRMFAFNVTLELINVGTVGVPLTLKAHVTATPGPSVTKGGLHGNVAAAQKTYRFTYVARRLTPCAETIPIPGNGSSTTWTPPANKAGNYEFAVTAVERVLTLGEPATETTATATSRAPIKRDGPPAEVTSVTLTYFQGLPGLMFTGRVVPPGANYRYHFSLQLAFATRVVTLAGGCDGDEPSCRGGAPWNAGFDKAQAQVLVDQISKSDCTLIHSEGWADVKKPQ